MFAWTAADSTDVKDFRAKHGRDLYMTDIDEYDRICKVTSIECLAGPILFLCARQDNAYI